LLQFRRPVPQLQVPPWQTWPAPQACPQLPQFALSVAVVTHALPHAVCPEPHWEGGVPLLGDAQLAARTRQANEKVRRAERDRVFIDEPRR
jgi:hypothetical protein